MFLQAFFFLKAIKFVSFRLFDGSFAIFKVLENAIFVIRLVDNWVFLAIFLIKCLYFSMSFDLQNRKWHPLYFF